MSKKALLLVVTVIIAIIIACFVISGLPKCDNEEIAKFQSYKNDFEVVNNYFTETNGNSPEKHNVLLDKKIFQIVGLYDGETIQINKELKTSLNAIVPAFENYDFSFINVNEERIAYCGEGYLMYVYSRDGKTPTYYYHEGDGMHPEVCELGDNWYLLKVNFR